MIAVYQNHNLFQKQWAKVINSTAQSGLLISSRPGRRIVIDDYVVSILGQDNASATACYNIVLVTCTSAGVPSPAAPAVLPVSKLYKLIPFDTTVGGDRYQLQDSVQGRIELPDGASLGWYCYDSTTIGVLEMLKPLSINLRVSAHFEPCESRDPAPAFGAIGMDTFLQPNGTGAS